MDRLAWANWAGIVLSDDGWTCLVDHNADYNATMKEAMGLKGQSALVGAAQYKPEKYASAPRMFHLEDRKSVV